MRRNAKVYVMRHEDGQRHKIGNSRNPQRRAKEIRGATVVFETDVLEDAEVIEKRAHRVLVLSGQHVEGEWFNNSLEEAKSAIKTAMAQIAGEQLELAGRMTKPKADTAMVHLLLPKQMIDDLDKAWQARRVHSGRASYIRYIIAESLYGARSK